MSKSNAAGTEPPSSSRYGRTREMFGLRLILGVGALLVLAFAIVMAVRANRTIEAELSFQKVTLKIFADARKEALEKAPDSQVNVSNALPNDVVERIKRNRARFAGASILWVDDRGLVGNSYERRAFSSLGILVDTVASTEQAMEALKSGLPYDAIITDLHRPAEAGAACYPGSTAYVSGGCRFIQAVRQLCGETMPPVIIYAANNDASAGTPPFAAGMTNRFDKLTNYVLDALERRPTEAEYEQSGSRCGRNPILNPS